MPVTPDRDPGVSQEEGTIYSDEGVAATQAGEVRYNGGQFSLYDAAGEFDPLGVARHKAARDLIHFIEGPADGFVSGAFLEQLPAGNPFPTSAIWYESAAKLKKIVEVAVTYNANKTVDVSTWKMYATDGSTVLIMLVDTHVYSGIFLSTVTRTWS